jgi:mannose-1-phosphate guanylyltransferase
LVSGDDRPKQFCRLVGEQSLLAQTRARVARVVPADRQVLVFTECHERFYSEELAAEPASNLIIQPCNRGTTPAILWSLLRVQELDPDAVVAIFPSDHHYSNERKFLAGVRQAFRAAERNPSSVMILGAQPTYPEVAYGWIESKGRRRIRPVTRFWEKPNFETAENLLKNGCLWNTFVMVASAGAFLAMAGETVTELHNKLNEAAAGISQAYPELESSDFAKHVLCRSGRRLTVVALGDVGWSDLGDPSRALAVLSEERIPAHGTLLAQLSAAAG